MAGVESTTILAQLTALHWLEANRIDPRQSMLYLDARYDLPLYIGTVKTRGGHEGHDITGYLQTLNQTYTSHYLSGARLRSLSWINLADPLTYIDGLPMPVCKFARAYFSRVFQGTLPTAIVPPRKRNTMGFEVTK